jgi:hypothetical protein
MRPRIPFSATWNSAILRRFDLDTVHMEDGYGGKHYLLQALEPSIAWPEARASTKNDSEAWAAFIYQEIICRYGCIPYCLTDGGPEFRGAAEILFKQYGITVIISSPYHPQGNAAVERSHQTLGNSIRRACAHEPSKWPLYVQPALLAMRCTVSRATGYTPYFLLYGRHPILAFDVTDSTWEVLDWHTVHSTEDLLAIRTQQILRRDKKLAEAHENQRESRQRAVDDFNKRYGRMNPDNNFQVGTWVWLHETWLDEQKGNKDKPRWTGPFIIHERLFHDNVLKAYKLRELDGIIKRTTAARDRVKVFYYRPTHQTIKTCNTSVYRELIALFPDPVSEHEDGLYQRCVGAVTGGQRRSYTGDTDVLEESIMPVLDIAHLEYGFSLNDTAADRALERLRDSDLTDIYESPNLVWEPIFYNDANEDRYAHPMIGDLDRFFHGGGHDTVGTLILQYNAQDWDARRLMAVTHNIADLDKWTDEMLALRPNYC